MRGLFAVCLSDTAAVSGHAGRRKRHRRRAKSKLGGGNDAPRRSTPPRPRRRRSEIGGIARAAPGLAPRTRGARTGRKLSELFGRRSDGARLPRVTMAPRPRRCVPVSGRQSRSGGYPVPVRRTHNGPSDRAKHPPRIARPELRDRWQNAANKTTVTVPETRSRRRQGLDTSRSNRPPRRGDPGILHADRVWSPASPARLRPYVRASPRSASPQLAPCDRQK